MRQRVLLATFSNTPSSCHTEALSPPLFHFDPFGTEFREPGRISHPITKILPAFAGVPGDRAPVSISLFPR
jgi:hypothetical protein